MIYLDLLLMINKRSIQKIVNNKVDIILTTHLLRLKSGNTVCYVLRPTLETRRTVTGRPRRGT